MSRILQKNSIMNLIDLSEQEVIRRNSMEQLRSIGVEPYPAAEYVKHRLKTTQTADRYKLRDVL